MLDELADERGVALGTLALAWLRTRATVAAPIASARDVAQLEDLLAVAEVTLDDDEVARLDAAFT